MSILKRIAAALLAGVSLAVTAAGLSARESAAAPNKSDAAESQNQQIARLITQLGDKEYFVRQRAQNELAKFGFEAFDALSVAAAHEDLEVAARARYLLRLMRVEWTTREDPQEVKKLLADYEGKDMATKLGRMRALADLPNGSGLPALCRLVRYEKSSVLSKQAAIQLLGQRSAEGLPTKPLVDGVQKNLAHSTRPAARWLVALLRFSDDARAALGEWVKLVDAEQMLLRNSPGETSAEIVAALLRFQIDWLKRLDQTDQAMAAMRRLIDLEEGDPATLLELLDWLVRQKAWKAVEEMEQRFQSQIQQDAVLLYTLAQAYVEQGDKPRAEKMAELALKLHPGKELDQLVRHLPTAYRLRQRGLFAWAEREYRHVIANGPAAHDITAVAYFGLSEMFHDEEKDEEAAALLESVLKIVQKQRPDDNAISHRSPDEIRSRMHYFLACHFKKKNDPAQQREHLEAALKADDADIDALIACYRLPNQPAEQRQKVVDRVRTMAADLQQQINDEPNDANNYNQYAWLVGNTEGDFDLAIRYSKKSIELRPTDNAGYYDTLAHAYFASGEHENAVKAQTKAAQLEPHSGQIQRELKLFQAKLESERKKTQPQPQENKPQEEKKKET